MFGHFIYKLEQQIFLKSEDNISLTFFRQQQLAINAAAAIGNFHEIKSQQNFKGIVKSEFPYNLSWN